MQRKVAVVDNDRWTLFTMKLAAEAAGHQVLGVHIGPTPEVTDDIVDTVDFSTAINAIKSFGPELVFIDHDFGLGEDTGREFAQMLGFPSQKCIGTSHDFKQEYCLCQLSFDKAYFNRNMKVRNEFLSWIGEVQR